MHFLRGGVKLLPITRNFTKIAIAEIRKPGALCGGTHERQMHKLWCKLLSKANYVLNLQVENDEPGKSMH